MEITEKVAYLKGLMEGLGIDKNTNDGKVFHAMIDLLDDLAYTVSDLESGIAMVAEQVDMMDEDIEEIKEELYDCDCCCDDEDDDYDDEYEGELYEVTCPTCGDTVCIDEDMLDEGELICPGCGELLEFDLEGIDEEGKN